MRVTEVAHPERRQRPERPRKTRRLKWDPWKTVRCGTQRMSVKSHTHGSAATVWRCNTAGCVRCDRKRLARTFRPLTVFRLPVDLQWWLVTLTWPARVTPGRVRARLKDVRAAFRDWQAAVCGAWRAEVTSHPEDGYTSAKCPWRRRLPKKASEAQVELRGRCVGGGRAANAAGYVDEDGRYVHPSDDEWSWPSFWEAHDACPVCGGAGRLPMGHVHVHAVVAAPAWLEYGAELEYFRERGFGRGHFEPLDDEEAGAAYAAKAYSCKGSGVYQEAYLRTQGRVRAAGRFGTPPGVEVRAKAVDFDGFDAAKAEEETPDLESGVLEVVTVRDAHLSFSLSTNAERSGGNPSWKLGKAGGATRAVELETDLLVDPTTCWLVAWPADERSYWVAHGQGKTVVGTAKAATETALAALERLPVAWVDWLTRQDVEWLAEERCGTVTRGTEDAWPTGRSASQACSSGAFDHELL